MFHHLILYGTSACHLCEQAEDLVRASLPPSTYLLKKVDVAEDAMLMEKYGMHIPVLEKDGKEDRLYWPFGKENLLCFLAKAR